jgi:sulfite exporter TauE/SafE/copper chaperone CopZ
MTHRVLRIGGLTCTNCQNKIERKLTRTPGIESVRVSYSAGTADVTFDETRLSQSDICAVVEKLGYEVLSRNARESTAWRTVAILIIIAALYMLLSHFGVLTWLTPNKLADTSMSYGMLFIIGLITSVHCVAMCGGINLSQSIPAQPQNANIGAKPGKSAAPTIKSAVTPTLLYNLGRVISYTAVGFIVGALGSVITFSPTAQGVLKLIAGVFMIIMGVNMLGIFPQLRKIMPRLPRSFTRRLNSGISSGASKRPLIVGLLNGLMPCGPLQSMQIYALSTGNPVLGALSMFLFALGTVPLMFGLGSVVSALGHKFAKRVMTVGAVLVAVLGLAMLSQGWTLTGVRAPSLAPPPAVTEEYDSGSTGTSPSVVDGVQLVSSTLKSGAYPTITVQSGTPVKWTITAPDGSINGCNKSLYIPEYGIEYAFAPGENVIEFTPDETGTFLYSCWMGMIRGTINVI